MHAHRSQQSARSLNRRHPRISPSVLGTQGSAAIERSVRFRPGVRLVCMAPILQEACPALLTTSTCAAHAHVFRDTGHRDRQAQRFLPQCYRGNAELSWPVPEPCFAATCDPCRSSLCSCRTGAAVQRRGGRVLADLSTPALMLPAAGRTPGFRPDTRLCVPEMRGVPDHEVFQKRSCG